MSDNKKIYEEIKYDMAEDVSKYGEFVSSYFAWVVPEKQKEITNKLENITKDIK